MQTEDRITPDEAHNLSQLFFERVARCPDKVAYQYFNNTQKQWHDITWQTMADNIGRWQNSLKAEGLNPGERIAIMLKNSPEWVLCEQAALGLGLVVVPLYINDRAENAAYILDDANVKIIFIDCISQYNNLKSELHRLTDLKSIVSIHAVGNEHAPLLEPLDKWLQQTDSGCQPVVSTQDKHSLASIVYTSGTTGKPKGVMLSHGNILWNAYSSSLCYPFKTTDVYLSFLPLSHMFERSIGYYLPVIAGSVVAYARSIDLLGEDLVSRQPTILVTVPRIFERVANKIYAQLNSKSSLANYLFRLTVDIGWLKFQVSQNKTSWKAGLLLWPLLNFLVARKIIHKLGGRMRLAISGGAPLAFNVGKLFTSLGLTISQGYGMTESSPVVCTNRIEDNEIASVGQPLPDVEVKLGDSCELLVRSPGIMLGYWRNQVATKAVIDSDGWLHTGDQAKIHHQHIYITGRLKEILVLSNGEKISPCDLESAICADPIFEQAMVVGEGKAFLSALLVLDKKQFELLSSDLDQDIAADPNSEQVTERLLQRVRSRLTEFPGYTKIYRIHATFSGWTVENSLLTPTLKLKRHEILDYYDEIINDFYKGH